MKKRKKKILLGAIIALIVITICFFADMYNSMKNGKILVEGNDMVYFTIEYLLFFGSFIICLVMELIYDYKKNERIVSLKKRLARYVLVVFVCFIPVVFFQGKLSEKYTTSMAALNKREDDKNSQLKNDEDKAKATAQSTDINIEKDSKPQSKTKETKIPTTVAPIKTEKPQPKTEEKIKNSSQSKTEKKQDEKVKATKNPKKKEKSDYKLIFSEETIKGGTRRYANEKKFVKQLKKICKKYTVTELDLLYEPDEQIYLQIACNDLILDSITSEIAEANNSTEYNNHIMIDFIDESRYQDSSAEGIVWRYVDIDENGNITEY